MLTLDTAVIALSITILVHLFGTVWWASRLTARVDHIERWITLNEQNSVRLTALEVKIAALETTVNTIAASVQRIADKLDRSP